MSFKSIGITSGIAFALLLAGCGGSGSDIKVIPSPKPTPDIPSPNPKPGNNVYRSMSSYNSTKHTSDGSVSNNAPSFDTLTFNGRELPLVVENIKNGRIVALDRGVKLGGVSYKKFYVGTTRQANARFGALNYDGNNIVFHQGHLSAQVPTRGEAEYVGDVIHVNNADNSYTNGIMIARANFADKTLKMAFTKPGDKSNFVNRNLEATINGNKFSGLSNDTHVDGAFYGNDAKEMAGHYTNAKENFQGAFGGTQQWSRGTGTH